MEENNYPKIRAVMIHLITWLTQWLTMRNNNIGDKRMNFLCICYCTYKAYLPPANAVEAIMEINRTLSHPFSPDKLRKHIIYSIDKNKEPLRYTNQRIKEVLGITDEEYIQLDPDKHKRELLQREKNTAQKETRNIVIMNYYWLGYSTNEIHDETGYAVRTINRVLSSIKQADKQKRNKRIFELHQLGFTNNQISQEIGCGRNLVGRILAAPFRPEMTILKNDEEKSDLHQGSDTLERETFLFGLYQANMIAALGKEQLEPSTIFTNKNDNYIITGNAGTGKSYLIKQYLESLTTKQRKKILIVAPTWKAASNINGITVHKAFELKPTIQTTDPITTIPKALRGKDTIIIDEISMLRIDVFNRIIQIVKYIEAKRKRHVQLILIGDFGQLQPVCTQSDLEKISKLFPTARGIYCFNAPLWKELKLKKVTLYQQHRQSNSEFAEQLTKLKYGCTSAIEWFNGYKGYFGSNSEAITIVPTNEQVQKYNEMAIQDRWYYSFQPYQAEYDGPLTLDLPAPETIMLSPNCRIMILKNEKAYKNGQLGTVLEILDDKLKVRLDDNPNAVVSIPKTSWTLDNGAHYRQFPVCLAYAITVNKAQGCTFDAINIDRGNGFWLPGQLYVALSRCRTINGINLVAPLQNKDLHYDEAALRMTF